MNVGVLRYACWIVMVFYVMPIHCSERTANEQTKAVYIHGAGPGVLVIVRNISAQTGGYFITGQLVGRCSHNASWQDQLIDDVRFYSTASADVSPASWFVKWLLFSREDAGCKARTLVESGDSKEGKVTDISLVMRAREPERVPFLSGKFRIETTVVDDIVQVTTGLGDKFLQLQVLVTNETNDPRIVAITNRELRCQSEARYQWVLGPDEAPTSISSGPVSSWSNDWIVFSQRVRGAGDPAACSVSITISEMIRSSEALLSPPYIDPPRWVTIETIRTSLKPTVRALYR